MDFETQVLHSAEHDKPLNSHIMPIFQTASFYFDSTEQGGALFAGKEQGHIYSRLGNPTVEQVEHVMAVLEEGKEGIAYGSGMGAVSASLLSFLNTGDHVIAGNTLYGCTVDLIQEHLPRFGVEATWVDCGNLKEIAQAFKQNTKIVYVETPANPTGRLCDLPAVAQLAHEHGALLVVDNTFSTPYFQKPLKLGADIVLHSCTKYLNGHSDSLSGIVVTSTTEQAMKMREWRKVTGSLMSPFDAFLLNRGIETLPIRMDRIQQNALAVAEWLEDRPEVLRVNHPGLKSFPQYELGKKIMKGYSGCFSFELKDGFEAAKKLLDHVKVMTLCVSLGAPDTLIQHPASMTHACVPPDLMKQQGLTTGMIRISVGLESVSDILADFQQAFEAIKQ